MSDYLEYEKLHTGSWNMEEALGEIELWSYFDMVEWRKKYTIKINGESRLSFRDSEINPWLAFEIAKKLLKLNEDIRID